VACIPQAWAAASVFALVQASLGLGFTDGAQKIHLDHPRLPRFLNELHLRGLHAKGGSVDIIVRRQEGDVALNITRRDGDVPIVVLR
jgi:glycogen debranching enzyme